jgi:Transposase IS4
VSTTSPTTPDRRITRHMDSPLRRNVVATAHGYDWHDEPAQLHHELGVRHRYRSWSLQTAIGDTIRAGDNCDEKYSRLDIFLMMFPPKQLEIIQQLTSRKLAEKNLLQTTIGEIVRFFGSLVLMTRYEFTTRASLWASHPPTKYETAPMFGQKTRFTRKRFNELFTNIRFGDQPDQKPDHLTSEQYRWLLVDGFVKHFNDHRRDTFKPADTICVDESISRWYRQGGDWINHGLPMYIAIDRKPENGCEIQDSCCGQSGVMLQLLIVKTKREQENNNTYAEANENHGTAVLKKLVSPWAFSDQIVCADSYLASVNCCEALMEMGLKFVGVVKTATKKFPMNRLSTTRLHQRGDRYGLVHKNVVTGRPKLIAFVWLDRERRYFISSDPCLVEGTTYRRMRLTS